MPDLIAKANQWLAGQRRLHLATDVTWSRGAQSATAPAAVGRTTWEVESATGRVERMESRDFIVAATDLPTEPREGDRIAEVVGSTTYLYEVMAPGGQPAVHPSDATRTGWRIHTKQVGRTG